MTNQPILFLDSGIGGIPYCRHFLKRNPDENIVYLADRQHFPYGSREKEELIGILSGLMELLIQTVNPKIAVLVCNTATLAALTALRERFPALPIVGTVPAVKPAALATKTGKIGVLGTELTAKEAYNKDIAARYGNNEIIGIGASDLVDLVENRLFTASDEEKESIIRSYLNRFRAAGVDTLVLGCTHFLFLQEEFQRAAAPDVIVFESLMGISRRIESLLTETVPRQVNAGKPQRRLLLTGSQPPGPSWISWADRLNFSLSLLEPSTSSGHSPVNGQDFPSEET